MRKALAGLLLLAGLAVAAPRAAFAGSAADAALGLGAFAVFNQILSGTGLFGAAAAPYREVVVAPPPVVVQQPPAVIYTPPPPVVYAPVPPVVYAPPPAAVYQVPPPAYYESYIQYTPAWCPPGLAKQGRCYKHWRHHDDD